MAFRKKQNFKREPRLEVAGKPCMRDVKAKL